MIPFLATIRKKYRRYSAHVLGFRHFSEGRDGFKPVQRRALWSMYNLGAVDKSHMQIAAKICGDTMGSYHPHEDGSIAGALANMTQAHSLSPTVVGIGNWGNHESDAGAIRYTKAYLSKYALTMLDKDELTQVPMDKTYDGKNLEPRFLPTPVPHLLLSGCESIAPGYRGKIPPSTADWVLSSMKLTAENKPLKLPTAFAHRWGGKLLNLESTWTKTGKGSASYRPILAVDGKNLVNTSLAPTLSLDSIEARLSKLSAFSGMVGESPKGEDAVRIVLRAKRGTDLRQFGRDALAKLRVNDHYSFLHIRQRDGEDGDVDYDPIIEGPQPFLKSWLTWRRTIISGAAAHRIKVSQIEIRKLELILRMIDLRKQLLALLDKAKDRDDLRVKTKALLKCTDEEVVVAMGIAWTRLAFLESAPLKAKIAQHHKDIVINKKVVSNPDLRLLPDAEASFAALAATLVEVKDIPVVKRRKKNG